MSKKAPDQKAWYLRRDGKQAGPFSSARIRRLLLKGQIALDDEVSADRNTWTPVGRNPEVVPRELRAGAEELSPVKDAGQGRPLPWIAIGMFVLVIGGAMGFAFWWGGNTPRSDPDCSSLAAAGVDWRNCRLSGLRAGGSDLRGASMQNAAMSGASLAGSDLSAATLDYADLSRADLAFVVLKKASLRGVDLRGADLSQANFSNADLRFADLTDALTGGAVFDGALMGNAIWTDGETCAPESVGGCTSARQ